MVGSYGPQKLNQRQRRLGCIVSACSIEEPDKYNHNPLSIFLHHDQLPDPTLVHNPQYQPTRAQVMCNERLPARSVPNPQTPRYAAYEVHSCRQCYDCSCDHGATSGPTSASIIQAVTTCSLSEQHYGPGGKCSQSRWCGAQVCLRHAAKSISHIHTC